MTPEFEAALHQVMQDAHINPAAAEITAAGVQRTDVLEFLNDMLEDRYPDTEFPRVLVTSEFLSVLVQWSVALGVHLERARWEETEPTSHDRHSFD